MNKNKDKDNKENVNQMENVDKDGVLKKVE